MKMIEISMEKRRVYHYTGGKTFEIEAPLQLHIIEDEKGVTHRVVAADGMTYRPERGWLGISWEPKPGEPAFVA